MPNYDYECKACGHTFTVFQNMKEDHLKTCPKCKKDKLKRLLGSGAGFIFKGSGFYCTDYRSPTYSESAKKDTAVASPTTAPSTPAAAPAPAAPKAETKKPAAAPSAA